uniref:Uncharacterized protein n=1 Tax=Aplanochytrium stocchinoi TaxID=215587 RepID=A0A7S3LQ31_9STRA
MDIIDLCNESEDSESELHETQRHQQPVFSFSAAPSTQDIEINLCDESGSDSSSMISDDADSISIENAQVTEHSTPYHVESERFPIENQLSATRLNYPRTQVGGSPIGPSNTHIEPSHKIRIENLISASNPCHPRSQSYGRVPTGPSNRLFSGSNKIVHIRVARKRSLQLLKAAHKKAGVSQKSFYKKMKKKREVVLSNQSSNFDPSRKYSNYSSGNLDALSSAAYTDGVGTSCLSESLETTLEEDF